MAVSEQQTGALDLQVEEEVETPVGLPEPIKPAKTTAAQFLLKPRGGEVKVNGDAGGSAEEETEPKQEQKTTETSTTLEVTISNGTRASDHEETTVLADTEEPLITDTLPPMDMDKGADQESKNEEALEEIRMSLEAVRVEPQENVQAALDTAVELANDQIPCELSSLVEDKGKEVEEKKDAADEVSAPEVSDQLTTQETPIDTPAQVLVTSDAVDNDEPPTEAPPEPPCELAPVVEKAAIAGPDMSESTGEWTDQPRMIDDSVSSQEKEDDGPDKHQQDTSAAPTTEADLESKGQVEQVIEQVVGKSPTKLETGASLDIGAVQTSEKRPPSPAAPTVAPESAAVKSEEVGGEATKNVEEQIGAAGPSVPAEEGSSTEKIGEDGADKKRKRCTLL